MILSNKTIEEVEKYILSRIDYHYTKLREIENGVFPYREMCDKIQSADFHREEHNAIVDITNFMGISDKVKEIHNIIDGKYK